MNKRGAVLVISLLVLLVLSILSGALVSFSIFENDLASRFTNLERAFWLAEAGIQKALWELTYNNCAGCTQCGGGSLCISGNLGQGGACGDYEAAISNDITNIVATGYFPNKNAVKRLTRAVSVNLLFSPFHYAIFGKTSVKSEGNANIDSYNSNMGPYDKIKNKGLRGDVATNGNITVVGSAGIDGNASTGPGGSITLQGGGSISGSQTHSNDIKPLPVSVPQSLVNLPYQSPGYILLSGKNKTLPPGDYKFSSINLTKDSILTIGGPGPVNIYLTDNSNALNLDNTAQINISSTTSAVKVYVDGSVNIGGKGVINPNRNPPAFIIYGTPLSKSITIGSNAAFYGAIYAPSAALDVTGQGDLYGAFACDTIQVSGLGKIHYDEALSGQGGSSNLYIKSWADISKGDQ